MSETYAVNAVWDEEAAVFYAVGDIPGLNVEAATLAEFVQLVEGLAPELLSANGLTMKPVIITGQTELKLAS